MQLEVHQSLQQVVSVDSEFSINNSIIELLPQPQPQPQPGIFCYISYSINSNSCIESCIIGACYLGTLYIFGKAYLWVVLQQVHQNLQKVVPRQPWKLMCLVPIAPQAAVPASPGWMVTSSQVAATSASLQVLYVLQLERGAKGNHMKRVTG